MIMLDQLKEVMDDIERENNWAFTFIQDILIKKEEGEYTLSKKQFNKLVEIHNEYYLKY